METIGSGGAHHALQRCEAAALLSLTTPCEGDEDAALLIDQAIEPSERQRQARGILGCVSHGAQLYTQMHHARVYSNGDAHSGAAMEVYRRAQDIAGTRADAHVGDALAWVWDGRAAA